MQTLRASLLLPVLIVLGGAPRGVAADAPPIVDGFGDFGSSAPIERADMPTRGIVTLAVEDHDTVYQAGPHWEQYNFPFKAKRWGKYAVRVTYMLKNASLGVQLKFGEERLKKTLTITNGEMKQAWLGEIYIPTAGDQFLAIYTPNGVGTNGRFDISAISLVPAAEGGEIKQGEDGSLVLEAKDATTWSENMRYEPKPEKNCLGYWTDEKDFAEWELKVDKPGKFKVTVHQGSKPGGSKVAVQLGEQKINFTVKDTGDFHKPQPVEVGEVKIDKPGTDRLAVKPESKSGGAIMDVQKVLLTPAS
jgi:hypothetical protein